MLVGIVGATYLSTRDAGAADLPLKAHPFSPNYAAVDGINGKAGILGGSLADRPIYAGKGTLSIPLGGSFGAQIDGMGGSWDHQAFGGIGGHLFWRDPTRALFGVYVSHTHWDRFGGVHVTQVAGEAEYYFGRWTLQGIAGVEFGNSAVGPATAVVLAPPGPGVAGLAGIFAPVYDIKTRFFDQINLAYYLTDNWKAFLGHRYLGGKHAFALGTEYGLPLGRGAMAAPFIEGRIGEDRSSGVWGGLKFYFGRKDKPLIQRHREDDPLNWLPSSLFTIANSLTANALLGTQPIPGLPDGDGEGCPDGDADGEGCPDGEL
jgi:hypothetical protein